jgi:hypothetical protein
MHRDGVGGSALKTERLVLKMHDIYTKVLGLVMDLAIA